MIHGRIAFAGFVGGAVLTTVACAGVASRATEAGAERPGAALDADAADPSDAIPAIDGRPTYGDADISDTSISADAVDPTQPDSASPVCRTVADCTIVGTTCSFIAGAGCGRAGRCLPSTGIPSCGSCGTAYTYPPAPPAGYRALPTDGDGGPCPFDPSVVADLLDAGLICASSRDCSMDGSPEQVCVAAAGGCALQGRCYPALLVTLAPTLPGSLAQAPDYHVMDPTGCAADAALDR